MSSNGKCLCGQPATTAIEVKLGAITSRTKPTKLPLCPKCAELEKQQEQEIGACNPQPKSYRFYPR